MEYVIDRVTHAGLEFGYFCFFKVWKESTVPGDEAIRKTFYTKREGVWYSLSFVALRYSSIVICGNCLSLVYLGKEDTLLYHQKSPKYCKGVITGNNKYEDRRSLTCYRACFNEIGLLHSWRYGFFLWDAILEEENRIKDILLIASNMHRTLDELKICIVCLRKLPKSKTVRDNEDELTRIKGKKAATCACEGFRSTLCKAMHTAGSPHAIIFINQQDWEFRAKTALSPHVANSSLPITAPLPNPLPVDPSANSVVTAEGEEEENEQEPASETVVGSKRRRYVKSGPNAPFWGSESWGEARFSSSLGTFSYLPPAKLEEGFKLRSMHDREPFKDDGFGFHNSSETRIIKAFFGRKTIPEKELKLLRMNQKSDLSKNLLHFIVNQAITRVFRESHERAPGLTNEEQVLIKRLPLWGNNILIQSETYLGAAIPTLAEQTIKEYSSFCTRVLFGLASFDTGGSFKALIFRIFDLFSEQNGYDTPTEDILENPGSFTWDGAVIYLCQAFFECFVRSQNEAATVLRFFVAKSFPFIAREDDKELPKIDLALKYSEIEICSSSYIKKNLNAMLSFCKSVTAILFNYQRECLIEEMKNRISVSEEEDSIRKFEGLKTPNVAYLAQHIRAMDTLTGAEPSKLNFTSKKYDTKTGLTLLLIGDKVIKYKEIIGAGEFLIRNLKDSLYELFPGLESNGESIFNALMNDVSRNVMIEGFMADFPDDMEVDSLEEDEVKEDDQDEEYVLTPSHRSPIGAYVRLKDTLWLRRVKERFKTRLDSFTEEEELERFLSKHVVDFRDAVLAATHFFAPVVLRPSDLRGLERGSRDVRRRGNLFIIINYDGIATVAYSGFVHKTGKVAMFTLPVNISKFMLFLLDVVHAVLGDYLHRRLVDEVSRAPFYVDSVESANMDPFFLFHLEQIQSELSRFLDFDQYKIQPALRRSMREGKDLLSYLQFGGQCLSRLHDHEIGAILVKLVAEAALGLEISLGQMRTALVNIKLNTPTYLRERVAGKHKEEGSFLLDVQAGEINEFIKLCDQGELGRVPLVAADSLSIGFHTIETQQHYYEAQVASGGHLRNQSLVQATRNLDQGMQILHRLRTASTSIHLSPSGLQDDEIPSYFPPFSPAMHDPNVTTTTTTTTATITPSTCYDIGRNLLTTYFHKSGGFASDSQYQAFEAVVNDRYTIVENYLPCGCGKTMAILLAAKLALSSRPGFYFWVVPYRILAQSLLNTIESYGIPCELYDPKRLTSESMVARRDSGDATRIIVAVVDTAVCPEAMNALRAAKMNQLLIGIVLDEAHNYLTTGKNFRPLLERANLYYDLGVKLVLLSGTMFDVLTESLREYLNYGTVAVGKRKTIVDEDHRIKSNLVYNFRDVLGEESVLLNYLVELVMCCMNSDVRAVGISFPKKGNCLVFCLTIRQVQEVRDRLGAAADEQDIDVLLLSSELSDPQRDALLAKIEENRKEGKRFILCSTSSAAEGLDLPGFAAVIALCCYNGRITAYQMANRAGRTGDVMDGIPRFYFLYNALMYKTLFGSQKQYEMRENKEIVSNFPTPRLGIKCKRLLQLDSLSEARIQEDAKRYSSQVPKCWKLYFLASLEPQQGESGPRQSLREEGQRCGLCDLCQYVPIEKEFPKRPSTGTQDEKPARWRKKPTIPTETPVSSSSSFSQSTASVPSMRAIAGYYKPFKLNRCVLCNKTGGNHFEKDGTQCNHWFCEVIRIKVTMRLSTNKKFTEQCLLCLAWVRNYQEHSARFFREAVKRESRTSTASQGLAFCAVVDPWHPLYRPFSPCPVCLCHMKAGQHQCTHELLGPSTARSVLLFVFHLRLENFKEWVLQKEYYDAGQLRTAGLEDIQYVPPDHGGKVRNNEMDENFHLFFEWIVYRGLQTTQNLMLLLEYYQEQPYESSRDGEMVQ